MDSKMLEQRRNRKSTNRSPRRRGHRSLKSSSSSKKLNSVRLFQRSARIPFNRLSAPVEGGADKWERAPLTSPIDPETDSIGTHCVQHLSNSSTHRLSLLSFPTDRHCQRKRRNRPHVWYHRGWHIYTAIGSLITTEQEGHTVLALITCRTRLESVKSFMKDANVRSLFEIRAAPY